jgi:hypothetical protein
VAIVVEYYGDYMILLAFLLVIVGIVIGGRSIFLSTREMLRDSLDTRKLVWSSFKVLSHQQKILLQTGSMYAQSYCKDITALEFDLAEWDRQSGSLPHNSSDNQTEMSMFILIFLIFEIIFSFANNLIKGKRDIA